MPAESNLLQAFETRLQAKGLLARTQRTLVAYSGGADSTCLLHMLHRLGFPIIAAHLHHGMRHEAEDEALACEKFCDSLAVPFILGRANVPAFAKERKIGIEEAGREARYEFLEHAAAESGCEKIATAHTKTDLAETVFLNMARGSGLAGLAGVPERRGPIVRPMLGITRDQARAYCQKQNLWFHDDPANQDLTLARVRARTHLLPAFLALHEGALENLARLAETAATENEFLDSAAAAALERCEMRPNGPLECIAEQFEVILDRNLLTHLPPVLLARGIRLAFQALGVSLDYRQTEAVLKGERGAVTAEQAQAVAEWDPERLVIRLTEPPNLQPSTLSIPGKIEQPALGWRIAATQQDADQESPLVAFLDPNAIHGPLQLAMPKQGAKIQTDPTQSPKRLADLFSAKGLSKTARSLLPVLSDDQGPIWVPAVAQAARTRVKTHKRAVRIELQPCRPTKP